MDCNENMIVVIDEKIIMGIESKHMGNYPIIPFGNQPRGWLPGNPWAVWENHETQWWIFKKPYWRKVIQTRKTSELIEWLEFDD